MKKGLKKKCKKKEILFLFSYNALDWNCNVIVFWKSFNPLPQSWVITSLMRKALKNIEEQEKMLVISLKV